MGVTRAFGRLIKNILNVITFGLVKASEPIEKNPQIVGLQYDEVIEEKADAARRIKDAIGGLIARQTETEQKVKQLTQEIEELEEVKAGAAALAKQQADKLRGAGKSDQEILEDPELVQLQGAYADAASTLEEKKARIADLEQQIQSLQESVDHYVLEAQNLTREIERLQSEKHETVASMEAARQVEEMNEALAGISTTSADETLTRLRQRRAEAEGRAKAAMKISETDTAVQQHKLRQAAQRSVQNREFLGAIGMGEQATAQPAPEEPDTESSSQQEKRLPE